MGHSLSNLDRASNGEGTDNPILFLPADIWQHLFKMSKLCAKSWLSLALAYPDFGRWTLTDEGRTVSEFLYPTVRVYVISDKYVRYYKNRWLHRDADLPAIERNGGFTDFGGSCFGESFVREFYHHVVHDRRFPLPGIGCDEILREWYKSGKLHRDNDLPAIEYSNTDCPAVANHTNVTYREWWKDGKLHRDGDLPAIVDNKHNRRAWYKEGKLHRDGDFPAFVEASKNYMEWWMEWWKDGQLHRDNDLPATVEGDTYKAWFKNGFPHRDGDQLTSIRMLDTTNDTTHSSQWYKNGKLHRDGDLPAVMNKHGKYWYKNDKLHRDGDLPAKEHTNGNQEWYTDGIPYKRYIDGVWYIGASELAASPCFPCFQSFY